ASGSSSGLARGIVEFRPWTVATLYQVADQEARDHAASDALSRIAGGDVCAPAAEIEANETCVIDRLQHLPRPAVCDFLEFGKMLARPALELSEPILRVVSFARAVILPADDQRRRAARSGLQPDIMIGIVRVPVECVGDLVRRDAAGDRVGSVGRLLRMD